jgi:hypothetical protein
VVRPSHTCPHEDFACGEYRVDLVRSPLNSQVVRPATGRSYLPSNISACWPSPAGRKVGQRRTLGYFVERKFGSREVLDKLKEYGFNGNNYNRVVVTWGWKPEAERAAKVTGVDLWDFREVLKSISNLCQDNRTYFIADTMRTVQLMQRSLGSLRQAGTQHLH